MFLEAAEDTKGGGGSCDGERKERRILRLERRFINRRLFLRERMLGWGNIDGMMTWTEVLPLVILVVVMLNRWCWIEIGRNAYAFFSDLNL